ncbi:hypothetical protein A2963_00265 [Candidatus Roizmanbacteria bacterium RIFCSPLOWO2_01_FULL_40_13]|nr:MAG: hypothetical protein A2963_00265 [Candidatus Roizmanbacteria bacterium RIFCSPLOWO2_01_FULL_40_13]
MIYQVKLSGLAPRASSHAPIATTWRKEIGKLTFHVDYGEKSNSGDKYKFNGKEIEEKKKP